METKQFLKQLLFIVLFLVLVLILTLWWLGIYTNHGQELELPDYKEVELVEAKKDAEERTFEIIVNDSIHEVGKKGGVIINQNPKAGSKVKENRKIYVTVTKYSPDKWKFTDLPALYGRDFDQKSKELSYMEINSKIKEYKYDPGEPNYILEVWYDGTIVSSKNIERKEVEIEKGGTLEFVLSEQSGGSTTIPNLVCYTLSEVKFLLGPSKLILGDIEGGNFGNDDNYYVVSQDPPYSSGAEINRGSAISVVVQEQKPDNCN